MLTQLVSILYIISTLVASLNLPCAYWCEGSCTRKVTSFYCCSYEPSLIGPTQFLPPPCTNLCLNRTGNDLAYLRNCKTEMEDLRSDDRFKICRNYNDCDPNLHDLCCPDNCLSEKGKMCVKL